MIRLALDDPGEGVPIRIYPKKRAEGLKLVRPDDGAFLARLGAPVPRAGNYWSQRVRSQAAASERFADSAKAIMYGPWSTASIATAVPAGKRGARRK
jgi:hypothetical protein